MKLLCPVTSMYLSSYHRVISLPYIIAAWRNLCCILCSSVKLTDINITENLWSCSNLRSRKQDFLLLGGNYGNKKMLVFFSSFSFYSFSNKITLDVHGLVWVCQST